MITGVNRNLIAEKLVELRGSATQLEVANDLGISASALSMYESGQRVPRDEVKLALARYYKTTVEAIFFADQVH